MHADEAFNQIFGIVSTPFPIPRVGADRVCLIGVYLPGGFEYVARFPLFIGCEEDVQMAARKNKEGCVETLHYPPDVMNEQLRAAKNFVEEFVASASPGTGCSFSLIPKDEEV